MWIANPPAHHHNGLMPNDETFTANEAAEQLGLPARTLKRYAIACGAGQREGDRGRFRFSKDDIAKIRVYKRELKEKLAEVAKQNGALSAGRPKLDPKTGRPIKRKSGRKPG